MLMYCKGLKVPCPGIVEFKFHCDDCEEHAALDDGEALTCKPSKRRKVTLDGLMSEFPSGEVVSETWKRQDAHTVSYDVTLAVGFDDGDPSHMDVLRRVVTGKLTGELLMRDVPDAQALLDLREAVRKGELKVVSH